MGLFDNLFRPKKEVQVDRWFKTFTAYRPVFRSFGGAIYESELVRAAIETRANHIGKLGVKIEGSAKKTLQTILSKKPNEFQTWSQFLRRVSTILDVENTCFIIPKLDRYEQIQGLFTALPSTCEIVEDQRGVQWLRFRFSTGDVGAVELNRCGIMTKFQYDDDFFGANNRALFPTMQLIEVHNQGIEEGVKNGATFRFMARMSNARKPEDLVKEQQAFSKMSLQQEAGGVLLFPNTFDDIRQIDSKPYTVDAEQMSLIQSNINRYFGVNDKLLDSSAIGDEMDGFYENVIEGFAIQLSEILTKMIFTDMEQGYGARVVVTANRLQYMKTSDKVNFIANLADRGFITLNEGRELLNYPPLLEGGDKAPIRGEFYFVGDPKEEPTEGDKDGSEK